LIMSDKSDIKNKGGTSNVLKGELVMCDKVGLVICDKVGLV